MAGLAQAAKRNACCSFGLSSAKTFRGMRWQVPQTMKKYNNGLGEAVSLFSFPLKSLIRNLHLLGWFALPLEFFHLIFLLGSMYGEDLNAKGQF